jgi:phosphoribosylglycinamide formyltransferase 1
MINIGVLVSGRGSNLQALIDAKLNIRVVISDKADAFALERARKHGIDAVYLDPKSFKDKTVYELEIVSILKKHEVGLVCLAGYMKIVGEVLMGHYPNKILNIHPSLLPAFPGLHAQKQALDYGARFSGATVHFVDDGCDTGPVILQAAVPVNDNDTEETLSARILEQEHKLYPKAVKLFVEGKLSIEGRKVRIL